MVKQIILPIQHEGRQKHGLSGNTILCQCNHFSFSYFTMNVIPYPLKVDVGFSFDVHVAPGYVWIISLVSSLSTSVGL